MTQEAIITLLGVFSSIAICAAGGGWWLKTQFTNQTRDIFKRFDEHAASDQAAFNRIDLRLMKVEMILHPADWPHIRLSQGQDERSTP